MSKKIILFVLAYILVTVSFAIYIRYDYYGRKETSAYNVYDYDSIADGDYISFNSIIRTNLFFFYRYKFNNEYFYSNQKGHIRNILNAYYCEDKNCLSEDTIVKSDNFIKLGPDNLFDYKVLNYEEVFKKKSNKYTGWNIYFKKIDYSMVKKEKLVGEYYDIYFVPTECKYNSFVNDVVFYKYIKQDFTVKKSNNDLEKNVNTYKLIENNDDNVVFEFDGKKGDIILFDIKSSSLSLEVYLNDENISKDLLIYDTLENRDFINNYAKKKIIVYRDGKNKLQFVEKKLDSQHLFNYNRYTYLKNFIVLRKSKEKGDIEVGELNDKIYIR